MKDRSASWMTLGLVFLLALSTFWLDYAVKLPQLRPVSKGHNIDFIIDGLHATSFSAQGKPESTLSAQTMIHYPDDNTLWMTAPDFTQIKQNKPTMTITAKRGKLLNNTRQIY
ncbi:MAG: LPS export ABC transporter periplasmic protein LptC, partial [Pseudomonadota bacterium]|nr:LPS export ABC transporter periplasmic protein LptC [Pseudomonadota bacterium]